MAQTEGLTRLNLLGDPVVECYGWLRKGWQMVEVGTECGMPQPSAYTCRGRFMPIKMRFAYRCEVCDDGQPAWRLDRCGDAVVSWACVRHLSEVCENMQRDHETTELVVKRAVL